jgi:hypothetical protein
MCDAVSGDGQPLSHPRWLRLYAVTLIQLAALAVVELAGFSAPVRTVLRCILTLGMFVGMGWWVHANRAAMDLEQWCDCASRTITTRVIQSRRLERSSPIPPPLAAPIEVDKDELIHV